MMNYDKLIVFNTLEYFVAFLSLSSIIPLLDYLILHLIVYIFIIVFNICHFAIIFSSHIYLYIYHVDLLSWMYVCLFFIVSIFLFTCLSVYISTWIFYFLISYLFSLILQVCANATSCVYFREMKRCERILLLFF